MKKIEENVKHGINILSLYSARYLFNKMSDTQLDTKLKAEDARHILKIKAIDHPVAAGLFNLGADIVETTGSITSEFQDWLE